MPESRCTLASRPRWRTGLTAVFGGAVGAPEPDAEKEALREEVARLRGERSRVKGLKAQLERSHAALADQRAAFLKQQVRFLSCCTSCRQQRRETSLCLPQATGARKLNDPCLCDSCLGLSAGSCG